MVQPWWHLRWLRIVQLLIGDRALKTLRLQCFQTCRMLAVLLTGTKFLLSCIYPLVQFWFHTENKSNRTKMYQQKPRERGRSAHWSETSADASFENQNEEFTMPGWFNNLEQQQSSMCSCS